MRIGIVYNKKLDAKSKEARKLARNVASRLRKNGHNVYQKLNGEILKKLDLVITFGGDGLVLHTANKVAPFGVPLFRINFGYLGFLTNTEPSEIFENLEKILKGDFHIEERARVEAKVFHGGNLVKKIDALNEVVIGGINRTVALRLAARIDRENFVAEARGDGLIISTKTGSTAYNINAGGAVLLAENVFSVVANNAFFKSDFLLPNTKSFVVPAQARFRIDVINQNKLNLPYVVADGQRNHRLKSGDYVLVNKSPVKTLFLEIGR